MMTCVVACGLIFIFTGCGHNPSVPESTTPQFNQGQSDPGRMVWGMYDVTIDANSGAIDIAPIRGAEFNANVVMFLQPPIAPIELLTLKMGMLESDLPNGLVSMDITIRHPFPGKNIFRGFDVRGIIMAMGDVIGKKVPALRWATPTQTHLINPDGFTRWWNQTEFTTYGKIFGYTEGHYAKQGFTSTSTLNPYKVHTPSLQPTQPFYQLDPNTRCTFPAVDGFVKRNYYIQFDKTQFPIFKFKYAIDASWSLPNPAYAPLYPVEAFDLKANTQEAYMVRVEEFLDIPYYVDEYVSGGDLEFILRIGDWQTLGGGTVLDQISHVWLESPTLFADPIDVRNTMTLVDGTTTPTQATYNIRIEDMSPKALEGQQLLISVESTQPNTYAPQIQGDPSQFKYPSGPLAAHFLVNVPVTNLTPQGNYAYVYFIPDWCGTMRNQCAQDADNQQLMRNIMGQNVDGYYNDFTHVQVWEGKTNTSGQTTEALAATCASMGYSFQRTTNPYFDATGSRVVIVVGLNMTDSPPNPPYTQDEAVDMQEFIDNGGILFFMCEASQYFNDNGYDQLFGWLGMLMLYGGGATPEMEDGWTSNITWHWITEGVETYHYFTCGEWITQDPYVLTLIATEVDEKVVLMYPIPLE